jgi:TRAP-type C4-dicarboxylate transport system permease small subunit
MQTSSGAPRVARGLERGVRALHRAEDALLALFLTATILLAALQIALRHAFDAGITWGDPLLRVLVLWLGLLGALAATRERRHITIDVIARLLPARGKAVADAVTSLFAAIVSATVAFYAARFVASEVEFGSVAFAGIPAWALEVVIPVAFGLIALRFLLQFATDVTAALSGEPPPP